MKERGENTGRFVCGFYGARDSYEVPAALEQAGLLEVLITDVYGASPILSVSGMLGRVTARRSHPLLPECKVRSSLGLALRQKLASYCIADQERRNHLPDRAMSRRIGKIARATRSNIFTYEPYAVTRPAGGFLNGCQQVVFYYHPHVEMEDAVYAEDRKVFPSYYSSDHVTESPWRKRTADAWRQADLVICASQFTKQTLMLAGMPEASCEVVPYGSMANEILAVRSQEQLEERQSRRGGLKLLFVGRNPLRKGLHHLLLAWAKAEKGPEDRLTIVCPERLLNLEQSGGVEWRSRVSKLELASLYDAADALVVPSLCEGFGHVYLEAMSHGCAVVGTANSALPDIGGSREGVFFNKVGDVGGLADLISRASADASIFRRTARAAVGRAGEFTWFRFREGLVAAVKRGLRN